LTPKESGVIFRLTADISERTSKIENHIIDLLTWADNVFEKSLNQPILPNAIIVVNGVESRVGS